MRLRSLVGPYAGQVRDYSTTVGLAALRSGTAVRLDDQPVRAVAGAVQTVGPAPEAKKVHARRSR